MIKVLFISSSGGHWVQLNRISKSLNNCTKIYITTEPRYKTMESDKKIYIVPDASRWNRVKVLWLAIMVFTYLICIRPKIIISTGAAPGFFGVFFGKLLGSKTIWIDSIANVDELSLSGRLIGRFSDLWLTQWEHLANPDGPTYLGSLI